MLAAAGHNLSELGDRVLHMFLNHALRDGFFTRTCIKEILKCLVAEILWPSILESWGILMSTPGVFTPKSCLAL